MAQFFRIIKDQTENLRYMIADLLDIARIEAGELPVAPQAENLVGLVDEARSRFQSGGGSDNLHISLPPKLPAVMADRKRIVQVLCNLLANASTNSHEESPIWVTAQTDNLQVAVSVADEGVGLSEDRLSKLFRKFSRFERTERSREFDGSGLGLASARASSRRTEAGSGPTATARGWAAASPSPSPWSAKSRRSWRRPRQAARRPTPTGPEYSPLTMIHRS